MKEYRGRDTIKLLNHLLLLTQGQRVRGMILTCITDRGRGVYVTGDFQRDAHLAVVEAELTRDCLSDYEGEAARLKAGH